VSLRFYVRTVTVTDSQYMHLLIYILTNVQCDLYSLVLVVVHCEGTGSNSVSIPLYCSVDLYKFLFGSG
jgi:hypothetical protein